MGDRLKAAKTTTIRRQIHNLVMFLIVFLSAVIVCVIVWNRLSIYNNERLTDQFLTVDGYFEKINDTQNTLNQYLGTLDEAEYLTLREEISECYEVTLQMREMMVMSGYSREIADLTALTEAYRKAVEELHQYIEDNMDSTQDVARVAVYSQEYETASRIRGYIMQQRTEIYRGIQQNIRQQRGIWNRRDKIFFAELVFVCLVLIGMAVKKAASLANSIVHPVEVLSEGAVKISQGSLEQIHSLEQVGSDQNEISFLTKVFNQMLERIQDQVQRLQETEDIRRNLLEQEVENLKVRERLKTSELKRFQTQINSHFLFNTLSTITQTAYLENADKTVDLMQTTAKFLRYSLESTDRLVTLSRELEALGYYITLQEQRFGKRLRFYFELQESCHQILVPALTLQPLVENAIIHGVGARKDGGLIQIKTAYSETEGQVMVQITDNGEGMEPDQLNRLRDSLKNPEDSGGEIGLVNVLSRLMLYYPGKAQMKIESSKGEGTKVELLIPNEEIEPAKKDRSVKQDSAAVVSRKKSEV